MPRHVVPSLMSAAAFLVAANSQEIPRSWDVELPAPLIPTASAVPPQKPDPVDFTVLTSRTKRMQVTEAPELRGLPSVTGTINVTVQFVEDPGLPDPPPPLPALAPEDPAVLARLAELRRTRRATKLAFVRAEVFDGVRTLLHIHPNGKQEQVVKAWSNIDFSRFSGFTGYQVKEPDGTITKHELLMGLGRIDRATAVRMAARSGREYKAPEIPVLPDIATGGPAFVVVEGDEDSTAMHTLEQIHDLYRKEGTRMEAVANAREKAQAERRAFLLANPPKPQDVVIRFWQKAQPLSEVEQLQDRGEAK